MRASLCFFFLFCFCVVFLSACSCDTCCVCMYVYVCIYMYELKLVHRYICVHACIYACIFEIKPILSYSNGYVLPSILVPVYVLHMFCYHTLLYGEKKKSISPIAGNGQR